MKNKDYLKKVSTSIFNNYSKFKLNLTPSKITDLTTDLVELLCPYLKSYSFKSEEDLGLRLIELSLNLETMLYALEDKLDKEVDFYSKEFFLKIPLVQNLIELDARAFFDGDPAASSIEEVVLSYPGYFAITIYRLANILYQLKVPLIPRIMTEFGHKQTGIDIHPGAQIGKSFFIDHGTGVVIGETTIIGDNVKIYQGVTLGALSVKKSLSGTKRHPTIEDRVVVYANATILGGETVIGEGSIIGGNCWITESIKPNSTILNKSEVKIEK